MNDEKLIERELSSERVYDGGFIAVDRMTVRPHNKADTVSRMNTSNPVLHSDSTPPFVYIPSIDIAKFVKDACSTITPFGVPVLPDVYTT